MVDGAGPRDRRPETLGDADHDVFARDVAGHSLAGPEAVLECHHHVVRPQEGGDAGGDGLDVLGLGGDHPQVTGPGVLWSPGHVEAVDDVLAARTGDGESRPGDGVDVLLPGVDGPQLVSGFAQEGGIDGPHGPGSDDGDLHGISTRSLGSTCGQVRLWRLALVIHIPLRTRSTGFVIVRARSSRVGASPVSEIPRVAMSCDVVRHRGLRPLS